MTKRTVFLLLFFFGVTTISFAAASSSPANVFSPISKIELKMVKKAEKAKLKAERKAERKARYMAWLGRLATKANTNWGAVVLCFFLGWLGIHRVVMGGSGLLILGYILTAGGIFGLLPLIDFIRLIIDSDHYKDNSRFFRAFE
jgi:TM2 domain-containing membrane protein YozV